jgi:hypothetical protein
LGARSDRWIGVATLPAAAAAWGWRRREGRRGLMTEERGAPLVRVRSTKGKIGVENEPATESVANRGDQDRPSDPVGHAPVRPVVRVQTGLTGLAGPGRVFGRASPTAAARHRAADGAGRRRATQGAGWREALLFFQIQNCGGRASDTPALVACCFAPPPTECAYVSPTYAPSYTRFDFRSLLAFFRSTVLICSCFVF